MYPFKKNPNKNGWCGDCKSVRHGDSQFSCPSKLALHLGMEEKDMKQKDNMRLVFGVGVLLIAAFAVSYFLLGGQEQAITGVTIDEVTGEAIGPWANSIVYYKLLTSDKYDGSDVAATAKVYDEKPADWNNPRGDFSDASLYTSYTAASGVVTINKEFPGVYYVVTTASGYNTEFIQIRIPDGTGRSADLSDYNAAADSFPVEMSLVGSTTDEDFAFTLTNGTNTEVIDQITLKLTSTSELKGWKAVITDTEGFSTDADNDGTYDEGVKEFTVSIGGKEATIFKPAVGIDEFDTNDKYTLDLGDLVVEGGDFLVIEVEITANTGDYTGANDEVWGEGEGVLSYIYVYDDEGNLFSTTDVTA